MSKAVVYAEETVNFRVVWKKQTFEVTFGLDQKVSKLKEHVQTLTGLHREK